MRNETRALALLMLGALGVRLAAIFVFKTYEFPDERSMGYEMGFIADRLASGDGFKIADRPTAWMAPLYPYLLGLIFFLFGTYSPASATIALVVQSVASALIVFPLYYIGKRLHHGPAAYLAAFLWILYPSAIFYSANFMWSSSFVALGLVLIVLLFLRMRDGPARLWNAPLGGLAIAITALADPEILGLAPFALLWLIWVSRRDLRLAVVQAALIATVMVVGLAPWTIRNYRLFNTVVPVKATLGVNLWLGNHGPDYINQRTGAREWWTKLESHFSEEEVARLAAMNEAERDKALKVKALEFIRANPLTFAAYTLRRVYLFWRLSLVGAGKFTLGLFYLLVCFGLVMSWIRSRDTALIVIIFAIYPIPYYLTVASFHRFRFPLESLMLLFLAHATVVILTSFGFAGLRPSAQGSEPAT